MSDILIKGMEMPTSCCQCPVNMEVCKRGYKYLLKHPELYDKRADDCPLVPVPAHGRLIDADLLCKVLQKNSEDEWNSKTAPFSWAYAYDCIKDTVEDMPTILEAEEGE